MKNLEIARIFNNIADILELQEVEFKPRAYRNAAQAIEFLSEDIAEIEKRNELEKIPGVGKHIAEKIREIVKTGKLRYYEKLKKEVKVDLEQLKQVPTLGPKKIKILYQKLKIKNIKDLEKAIKKNKIAKLKGFGEETQVNLLRGIKFVKTKPKRFLYAHALPIVNELIEQFSKLKFIKNIEVAGSFRRGKETIGDLDFLVVSNQPEKVIKLFTNHPDRKQIIAKGKTKSSIRLNNGLQIDLRVIKDNDFGSARNYFIGNKQHNIELRKIALSKGYSLSEYGLFKVNKNNKSKKKIAGKNEKNIYKKLGLKYIEPELREFTGEIEAARNKRLPKLVTKKDIKGIFHNHTDWSDGSNTLLEMAKEAEKLGLKFISFNDHFGNIGIANPLNEKRLNAYLKEIEKIRKKVKIKIFSGIEIDILKDGTLPLSKEKLKKLDIVIAAVHLSTKMSKEQMTKRVCYALENYPINILAHPTDRLLNHRPEIKIDLEKVFQVAKKNNVFIEINSSPERMDLSGENIKSAIKVGCKLAIGTDAHDLSHLDNYKQGVNLARRGWSEKKNILNCYSLNKIEKFIRKLN